MYWMEKSINYRFAKTEDSAAIAVLMVQAMGSLTDKFVVKDALGRAKVFEHFIELKNNLYSYENTLVAVDEQQVVGSITGYDGGEYLKLRQPFIDFLFQEYGIRGGSEAETAEGEFYLDTVSVLPEKQGMGIGSQLIQLLIRHAIRLGHKKMGLIVERKNTQAKKLYQKLGFHTADIKQFMGIEYEHMIFYAEQQAL